MTARIALYIPHRSQPILFARAAALARTLRAQYRLRKQAFKPEPRRPLTAEEVALIANLSSMR